MGVAMGRRSTGGYSVEVTQVVPEDGTVRVNVSEVHPGPRCMTTHVITTPLVVVRVKRATEKIDFVVERTVRECGEASLWENAPSVPSSS